MKVFRVVVLAAIYTLLAASARGQDEPRLVLAEPEAGAPGATLDVTLTGENTHFDSTSLAAFGDDIVVNGVTVADATSLTANVSIAWHPTLGTRDVTVTTDAETATGTGIFSVGGEPYVPTPTGLAATPGAVSIALNWDASPAPYVIGYNVYRDNTAGGDFLTKINSSPITATSFEDTSVTVGLTYFYRVSAVTEDPYESPKSDVAWAKAGTEEQITYQFDRLWPTLQQPWYFLLPLDVAVDSSGNVYVADAGNNRIQKFTSSGNYVTQWGSRGDGDGQFGNLEGIAVDSSGNVYVSESANSRIQKFTSSGVFITKWGSEGSGDGQFSQPAGIGVDGTGNVYVADSNNARIQVFTSSGVFVTKWGSPGSGDGQFASPRTVAIGPEGSIYVSDQGNHCIQKFDANGMFLGKWGSEGSGDGQFYYPQGVEVDSLGNVYVADTENHRIQKFTSSGTYVTQWECHGNGNGRPGIPLNVATDGSGNVYVADLESMGIEKFTSSGELMAKWTSVGVGDGELNLPEGLAVDGSGNVYVAECWNYRVQKFTSSGQFLTKWGDFGYAQGAIDNPVAVAVDSSGNVYVALDRHSEIRKFTSSGVLITQWGSSGGGDGQFRHPWGVAVDASGNVYVADLDNNRIQKFTSSGGYVTQWGSSFQNPGIGDGQFQYPCGVAVDGLGNVYVAEWGNHRIQKFTSTGAFVTKWGSQGNGDGQFQYPRSVAVDGRGNVYVADTNNNRIQEFTSSGHYVTQWGSFGSGSAQFGDPRGMGVDESGDLYVSDSYNNRIQKFKPVTLPRNPKAIVVAGGGPFSGNNLWDATQMCANFGYRALNHQGFTKGSIYYLSSDTDLDLDGNGIADDVNADVTNANLQYALTQWAMSQPNSTPTGDVVVYLVDHGGAGAFRMSGTETMSSTDLSAWLNTLQTNIVGKLIVVYDACESGSFLEDLVPPTRYEANRIVIASTSPGETANFVASGVVSFSNYFWTQVFSGLSVGGAFTEAAEALGESCGYQTPLLDDNGNGVGNDLGDGTVAAATFIGNGTQQFWERPEIGAVCDAQFIDNTAQATLWADPVTDADGIARVWAVVRHPDYAAGSSDNPVAGLPSIDLLPVGEDRYEATYNGFSTAGSYNILIYARDRIGNTSEAQMTTVTVSNPRSRKALIVAGGSTADPLWAAIESSARVAYEALTFQGYHDADIYYLSQTATPGFDGLAAVSSIDWAINTWAYTNTQDLTVCLVGSGAAGSFAVSDSENLSASQLDTWLDSLQSVLPGELAVVYDADMSGSFLPALIPPPNKSRMVVASAAADQTARFTANGNVSFSSFFWTRVLNGATVFQAFSHAAEAMAAVGNGQAAQLDDNGDGAYSVTDGVLSRRYIIGSGILLAGDDPLIGSILGEQTLSRGTSATLWADQVTTTGSIDAVYALITPPGSGAKAEPAKSAGLTVALQKVGPYRYELTWNGFWAMGDYLISVYAVDGHGNVSMPKQTVVHRAMGDMDEDGLLDDWETMDLNPDEPGIQNPFDPLDQDSTGDNLNPGSDGVLDGENDWDGDGMSNHDEFTFGFNPIDPLSFGEMPASSWVGLCVILLTILGIAVKGRNRRWRRRPQ